MTLVIIGCRPADSVGGVVLVLRCSGILLVLKLALDYFGLGAATGVLNPIDVLIVGCQDGLQLQLEGIWHSNVIIFFYLLNNKIFT
jgi:hypothetical protein